VRLVDVKDLAMIKWCVKRILAASGAVKHE